MVCAATLVTLAQKTLVEIIVAATFARLVSRLRLRGSVNLPRHRC